MAENFSRRAPAASMVAADFSKMGAGGLAVCVFWTNNTGVPMKVLAISERHGTAETTAGSLTAQVRKVPSGTAVGSGTALQSATFNLKAAANTNQAAALGDISALTIADGDSLGLDVSAAGTEIANMAVTVLMEPLNG